MRAKNIKSKVLLASFLGVLSASIYFFNTGVYADNVVSTANPAVTNPAVTNPAVTNPAASTPAQVVGFAANPEIELQTTITDLQNEISHNQAALVKNPAKLNDLVTKYLLPIIDVEKMAAMTLGPKWRTATLEQKQAFVTQFSLLLTRSYSRALLQMGDYKIVVFPVRGEAWKKLGYVAIAGQLSPKNGGSPSSVTYYMERNQGAWKIYDFALEGVSFAKNFRAQFDQFSDLSSLINKLAELNKSMSVAMAQGPNPAVASVIHPSKKSNLI